MDFGHKTFFSLWYFREEMRGWVESPPLPVSERQGNPVAGPVGSTPTIGCRVLNIRWFIVPVVDNHIR